MFKNRFGAESVLAVLKSGFEVLEPGFEAVEPGFEAVEPVLEFLGPGESVLEAWELPPLDSNLAPRSFRQKLRGLSQPGFEFLGPGESVLEAWNSVLVVFAKNYED